MKLSKPDRIRAGIDDRTVKITQKEIMDICPDISKITIERTLNALLKAGQIDKVAMVRQLDILKKAGYIKKSMK